MTTITDDLAAVAARIDAAERILLTCHRGPDGDSVGSMIALAALLRGRNRKVVLYNPDLVPRYLKFLPYAKTFVQQLKKKAKFDLTVIVDCGDRKLLGNNFPDKEVTGFVLAIDHHDHARPFGDLFVSMQDASSVGVVVARIASHLKWEVCRDAAQGIYVSIMSDTGNFRYANSNGEAMHLAASLVEKGLVDPAKISEKLSVDASRARYRLLSRVLAEMDVVLGGKVAFMMVTADLLKECKASWDDTEGLINYARSLKGVMCGVLITPSKYGGVRVSMRTRGGLDAGKICFALGGGGHPGAAGCTLEGGLAEARQAVEAAIAKALEHQSPEAQ